jgi:hypothetical protein
MANNVTQQQTICNTLAALSFRGESMFQGSPRPGEHMGDVLLQYHIGASVCNWNELVFCTTKNEIGNWWDGADGSSSAS